MQLRLVALLSALSLAACGGVPPENTVAEPSTNDFVATESGLSGAIIGTWTYNGANATFDACGCGYLTKLAVAPYGCYQPNQKLWYNLYDAGNNTWRGKRTFVNDCSESDAVITVSGNILTERLYKNGVLLYTYNWQRVY